MILVKFHNYKGPGVSREDAANLALIRSHKSTGFTPSPTGGPSRPIGMPPIQSRENDLIPIFPVQHRYIRGTATYTRTQFPLTVAHAITIHKSQSLSLDAAVMDLSGSTAADRTPGLNYVALSRVRSLRGVMFEEGFGIERFLHSKSVFIKERHDDETLRAKHYPANAMDFNPPFIEPPPKT